MSKFSGFYKLSPEERLRLVKEHRNLTGDEVKVLTDTGALTVDKADRTVENVIGVMHLPIGIATNFVINGKETIVPMAVEEPSVIAAACRAAKQSLPDGFKAEAEDSIMIGQVQVTDIMDVTTAMKNLQLNRKEVLKQASEFMKHVEQYGCGVRDFEAKSVETDRGSMIILNFDINVGNAQGANMVNTTLEGVSPIIEKLTEGTVKLRIVSNLATKRKVRASAVWKKELVSKDVIEGVLDAYEFAKADIYRCSTHNKGIMNGIDAVALAAGNDWRSVEAGAHSYAAIGKYQPLTHYYKNENGDLVGSIELPLALATVGPAISSSPTAGIALKIMDVKSSQELAMVMACVGLANNFAALSALGTIGIQKGHMKLHARNIAAYSGASTPEEIDKVAAILSEEKNFNADHAVEVLKRVREG
jgi:hydroxymethylglutaryl-CoA reductase